MLPSYGIVVELADELDRTVPRWWSHIDVDTLDLGFGECCVGGQLLRSGAYAFPYYATWQYPIRAAELEVGRKHPDVAVGACFMHNTVRQAWSESAGSDLRRCWIAEIEWRQERAFDRSLKRILTGAKIRSARTRDPVSV